MKTFTQFLILFLLITLLGCNKKQAKTEPRNLDSLQKIIPKTEMLVPKQEESTSIKVLKIKNCESLLIEILKSSPHYKQITNGLKLAIIENGGTDFEVSMKIVQNSDSNKSLTSSKIYEFTLFEVYPDRQLNTSRFTFNTKNMQLYEYDVVEDKLKPIEFNKELLEQLDSHCK